MPKESKVGFLLWFCRCFGQLQESSNAEINHCPSSKCIKLILTVSVYFRLPPRKYQPLWRKVPIPLRRLRFGIRPHSDYQKPLSRREFQRLSLTVSITITLSISSLSSRTHCPVSLQSNPLRITTVSFSLFTREPTKSSLSNPCKPFIKSRSRKLTLSLPQEVRRRPMCPFQATKMLSILPTESVLCEEWKLFIRLLWCASSFTA